MLKYITDALLAQTDPDAKIEVDVTSMKIVTKEAMNTAIKLIKYSAVQQHIFTQVKKLRTTVTHCSLNSLCNTQ